MTRRPERPTTTKPTTRQSELNIMEREIAEIERLFKVADNWHKPPANTLPI